MNRPSNNERKATPKLDWESVCDQSSLGDEHHTIAEVASVLNKHISTIWRWALTGVRGRLLPTVLIGGRRYVARSQLLTFLRTLQSSRNNRPSVSSDTRSASRTDAAEAAGKELDKLL